MSHFAIFSIPLEIPYSHCSPPPHPWMGWRGSSENMEGSLEFTNKDKQESNCSLIITSPFSTKKISPLPPSMSPVSKNIQKSNSHSLCKVGGIYIYIKFWNLNFTLAQKLFSKIREYIKTCILKVLYSYVFDCNVLGFINTKITLP